MRRLQHRIHVVLLLSGVSIAAYASYGGPDIVSLLEMHNLREQYVLLFSWTEAASSREGVFVRGCRLAPSNGEEAFDVYFDASGVLLEASILNALGVSAKNWQYEDVSEAAVFAPVWLEKQRHDGVLAPAAEWAPLYSLDVMRHDLLIEEDAVREAGIQTSLVRYGVNRRLETPIILSGGAHTLGAVRAAAGGGRQWAMTLMSPPAFGMRLYIEMPALPDGVTLFVSNADDPDEFFVPRASASGQWTPTIHSDVVTLVCHSDSPELLSDVELHIPEIIHVYRSPVSEVHKQGDCHIDVACEPDWLVPGSAVGRLGIVDHDAWACTGVLVVAPGYQDYPPFLLTAYHCVDSQWRADSLEVYWYYEKAACDSAFPPDMAALPRSTGGARFLVGAGASSGTDVSLLLLNEASPVSTAYLGFNTRPIALAEPVVTIHHPLGTEKRVSFGSLSDAGSPRLEGEPMASYARFHEVLWHAGSTERGSSGAPLILESTAQVVGQLYGGYASCTAMLEPDYYGRFDISFPLLQPWLYAIHPIDEGEGENGIEGEETFEGESPEEGEPSPSGCCPCPCSQAPSGVTGFVRQLGLAALILVVFHFVAQRWRSPSWPLPDDAGNAP